MDWHELAGTVPSWFDDGIHAFVVDVLLICADLKATISSLSTCDVDPDISQESQSIALITCCFSGRFTYGYSQE